MGEAGEQGLSPKTHSAVAAQTYIGVHQLSYILCQATSMWTSECIVWKEQHWIMGSCCILPGLVPSPGSGPLGLGEGGGGVGVERADGILIQQLLQLLCTKANQAQRSYAHSNHHHLVNFTGGKEH